MPTQPERTRRRRRMVGGLLLAMGLGAGAFALATRDAGPEQRPVGRLIGSDVSGVGAKDGDASKDSTTSGANANPLRTWTVAALGRPAALGRDGDPVPTAAPDVAPGAYLWNDYHGWHLWFVGDVDRNATVEVTTDDSFAKADPVGGDLEVTRADDRLTILRGTDDAPIVGVDFNAGYFARAIDVSVDGDVALFLGGLAQAASPPVSLTYGPT